MCHWGRRSESSAVPPCRLVSSLRASAHTVSKSHGAARHAYPDRLCVDRVDRDRSPSPPRPLFKRSVLGRLVKQCKVTLKLTLKLLGADLLHLGLYLVGEHPHGTSDKLECLELAALALHPLSMSQ